MTSLKPKAANEAQRIEDALRLLEAVYRLRALGWRTVTVDRLVRIANGDDDKAMPPNPDAAPKSARGTYHA
ncbi:hypothetical protein PV728_47980 [Streptomyces europaeiscabiei]|uniref:hypothetical protein n=1 Tax=Streptomyces europaeiscabiei TaxID=146819 RepID=UPI0029B9F832|nr:hypothetical protein [Streptomyces europaeiscabiei]MDX3637790.1 hypothetical protein [Streptomyces europaeiscabiei]MDX3655602.1 hypothetical protein [Streptomyces europaeiscabiei]